MQNALHNVSKVLLNINCVNIKRIAIKIDLIIMHLHAKKRRQIRPYLQIHIQCIFVGMYVHLYVYDRNK